MLILVSFALIIVCIGAPGLSRSWRRYYNYSFLSGINNSSAISFSLDVVCVSKVYSICWLHYGQATIQGFEAKGYPRAVSEALLKKSVEIACEARNIYHEKCQDDSPYGKSDGQVLKQRPILVAASVGSYGAYLADGSEYRCAYLSVQCSLFNLSIQKL